MLKKTLINVFDAYMYNQDGKLLMVHENLVNTSIAGNCDETEIRNGRGNSVFSTIASNKSLEVTLETNVFDFNLLCQQCGVSPVKKVGEFYTEAQVKTISADTIILDKTPKEALDVQIIDVATDTLLTNGEDYSIKDDEVTFVGTTGEVKVAPYLYVETEEVETITITADSFSQAGVLVLKGLEVDENQKPANYIEIVIERAKPSSSFTIDAQAELTGNNTTVTLKAMKDSKGNLGYIRRIPVA